MDKFEKRNAENALIELCYPTAAIYKELLEKGENEKADRLNTAYNTLYYLMTEYLKEE